MEIQICQQALRYAFQNVLSPAEYARENCRHLPVHQAFFEKLMLKKEWDFALIFPKGRDQYG